MDRATDTYLDAIPDRVANMRAGETAYSIQQDAQEALKAQSTIKQVVIALNTISTN
jgi:hypothetical protein